jgi:hypothetical protein
VEEPENLLGECDTLILAYYANTFLGSEPKSICVDHRGRVLDLMNLKVSLSKALIGILEFLQPDGLPFVSGCSCMESGDQVHMGVLGFGYFVVSEDLLFLRWRLVVIGDYKLLQLLCLLAQLL